jgi:hypothetical protein
MGLHEKPNLFLVMEACKAARRLAWNRLKSGIKPGTYQDMTSHASQIFDINKMRDDLKDPKSMFLNYVSNKLIQKNQRNTSITCLYIFRRKTAPPLTS